MPDIIECNDLPLQRLFVIILHILVMLAGVALSPEAAAQTDLSEAY